jgi:hypothetical protein
LNSPLCTAVCISIGTFEELRDEEEELRGRDVVLLRAFLLCFIPSVFHMTMTLVLRMEEGRMSSQIHSCHFLQCPEIVDTHRLHLVCNISHGWSLISFRDVIVYVLAAAYQKLDVGSWLMCHYAVD